MLVNFSNLRKAIPYLKAFTGKSFVIKLGGELLDTPTAVTRIIEQLSILSLMGVRIILIHGGGKHATALGERLGVTSEFVSGRRVTSAAMLEVAKMSFAGELNTEILAAFFQQGVRAVGLSGIDGGLIQAQKRPVTTLKDENGDEREVDFGFVGDILRIDPSILHHVLLGGYVPVICSLAADSNGQVLNINADTVASRIAAEVKAVKLIILGTVDGVLRDIKDPTTLYTTLTATQSQELLDSKVAQAGMIPKLSTALDALSRGVQRVHIINGLKEDSILQEIFTNEGCGTMITQG